MQDPLARIDDAQRQLVDALATNGPEFFTAIERAHHIKTGIDAVDALLPYCTHEREGHILARAAFLGCVLQAAAEPDKPDGRRRKQSAQDAAKNLTAAADLLDGIDNHSLADLLRMLTEVVESNAATCEICPETLSDVTIGLPEGISGISQRKAKMLMCIPYPRRLSESFTASRGRESARANKIRLIVQKLRGDAPPSAIARLLHDVLGIACSEADIVDALKLRADASDSPGADLAEAMKSWR